MNHISDNQKSLLGIFESVDDPRKPYNQRHRFLDIVAIVILATLCDADGWNEIADWAEINQEWLSTFLTLENGIPSHDTLNRIFQSIDPEQLHNAFIHWTKAIADELGLSGVIAIDGKTLRRSRETVSNTKPAHIVSAWSKELSLVLGQIKVDEKSNEITAIPELLKVLDVKGCIVTIDAMGTQKDIAREIIDKGADYILSLKENQATFYIDVKDYFETEIFPKIKTQLQESQQYHRTICNEHGRIETREYYISDEIEWLPQLSEWKGLHAIGARRSCVEENGTVTKTTQYMIISKKDMTAEEFAKSQRGHWSIENSLHWCLDIAFNEDSSRIRANNAAENMNLIRHMCLNMLKHEKTCKLGMKSKRKKCGWDREYLYTVLKSL